MATAVESALAPRRSRTWWWALALSILLHMFAIGGFPRIDLTPWRDEATLPPPLEARIVASAPKPIDAPAKPKPVARPKPMPTPLPPAHAALAPPPPAPVAPVSAAEPTAVDPDAPPDVPSVPPSVVPSAPVAAASTPAPEPPAVASAAPLSTDPVEQPATPGARYPLKRARIVYDVELAGGYIGKLVHTWSTDGETYHVETVAEGGGMVGFFAALTYGDLTQRSSGTFDASGLVPKTFDANIGTKTGRVEQATFDWHNKRVFFATRNGAASADLVPNVQDQLSMLHQLYFLKPLPNAMSLKVASGRKVGDYSFEKVGEERIETPLGLIETIHIRRTDDSRESLELWLDPARAMLPLRITSQQRNGWILASVVKELTIEPM